MIEWLQRYFVDWGLPPHGYCFLWDPTLIWAHVIADAVIGLSYFSIPIVLGTFLTRRRDVQFGWVGWMFAIFIMACGTTHFMSILVLWVPAYGVEGVIKAITAVASVTTAVALWPLLPRAVALPSPTQLQLANDNLRRSIDERDSALAALRAEVAERQRTEEMLRQSQKMEAVGQLTGGIAHDFNNLLTVVIANLDKVLRSSPLEEKVVRSLNNALSGAERAAELTDQLLTFARKQSLQPVEQDVNAIVNEMEELLERTLGAEVNIGLSLHADLPQVRIDRNQTENALLNLVINARDALPNGGDVVIATRREVDAEGRTLVVLSVTDNGVGMSKDIAARAVEPFFTTKAVGKGTGLGLSQVYGFAKQSDGELTIDSRAGEGTTVSLHFPAVSGATG